MILGAASGGSLESPKLRLCPTCVQHERRTFGYAVWHREHQFLSVPVCPWHRKTLWQTNASPHALFASPTFYTVEQSGIAAPLQLPNDPAHAAVRLSRDVLFLIEHPVRAVGIARVHATFHRALQELGYVRLDGSVRITRLTRDVEEHFGSEFLEAIHLRLEFPVHSNWLAELVRRPRHLPSPIRILLFARFLGFDASSLLTKAMATAPLPTRSPARPHQNRIRSPEQRARLLPVQRTKWLSRSGPAMSRDNRNLYAWLWRNDRHWLTSHCTPKQRQVRAQQDWKRLDEQLSKRIVTLTEWVLHKTPPTRASRHRLASLSGKPAPLLAKHPLLPRAVSCLSSKSESTEAFSCRRLMRAVANDPSLRRAPPWRLRVAAGIGPKQMRNPMVCHAFALVSHRTNGLPSR